jgi:hypothetical protein
MRQWGDYEVPGSYPQECPRQPWRYEPGLPGYGPLPQLLQPGPGPRRAPGSKSWVARHKGFAAVAAAGTLICIACVASAAESTRQAAGSAVTTSARPMTCRASGPPRLPSSPATVVPRRAGDRPVFLACG